LGLFKALARGPAHQCVLVLNRAFVYPADCVNDQQGSNYTGGSGTEREGKSDSVGQHLVVWQRRVWKRPDVKEGSLCHVH